MDKAASKLACGAWPSALSPQAAAAAGIGLGYAQADAEAAAQAASGRLYWIEGRPQEAGRSVLMLAAGDEPAQEVLPADANVRSRVHEYGGTPYAVHGGLLVHSDFRSQALVHKGRALTPEGCRYADGRIHPDGQRWIGVREDHRQAGVEPRNSLVQVSLHSQTPDAGTELWGESDFVAWPRLSPDGQRIAWVSWRHPQMPWDGTLLHMASLGDGVLHDVQTLAGGSEEAVLEPQWGEDGSLYFLSDRSGFWNLYRWREGATEALTTLSEAEAGGPLWNLGLSSYAVQGQQVLMRLTRRAAESLWLLDLRSRALQPLLLRWQLPDGALHQLNDADALGAVGGCGWLARGVAWANVAAADGLGALLRIDLHQADPGAVGASTAPRCTVLRSAGPCPLPADAVSKAQAIRFPTPPPGGDCSGAPREAHAWFFPPTHPQQALGAGEKPPLLVLLHGGPTSHATPAFSLIPQFWASRGFAVVNVNYGGSTGFGRAYRERLRGQWGVVDLADAVAAVDWLAAQGWVDGQRVAIRGGSAGGFTVLGGLAFTQRFAAGINYFGVADLETLAADTHKFEARYIDSLVAPLPEGRALYRERSPMHHMARARGALLTLQGSDDKAVPPQQSRDIVAAARAAGCRVAYLEFEGEGHGFRQGANIVRGLQAELAFLGEVFGFEPADAVPTLQWQET
jgi:dipeptidyl aminopeptidase/acylaminoacyl peptidase